MKKLGLLDVVAEQHRTFISNLRLLPELKWVSYLLGCEVHFENYEAIGKSLKPFSLQMR